MEFSFAVFFIVTLAAVHSGVGLECYTCDSKRDPNCMEGDKLDSFKTDCNEKSVEEAKKLFNSVSSKVNDWGSAIGLNIGKATIDLEMVCLKVDIENKDQTYTLRSCSMAKKDSDDTCQTFKETFNSDTVKVKHCSMCKDNLCNSSTGLTPTVFSIFIALYAVLCHRQ